MKTLEGASAVSNKRKATGTEAQSLRSFLTGRAVAAREQRTQMEHPSPLVLVQVFDNSWCLLHSTPCKTSHWNKTQLQREIPEWEVGKQGTEETFH